MCICQALKLDHLSKEYNILFDLSNVRLQGSEVHLFIYVMYLIIVSSYIVWMFVITGSRTQNHYRAQYYSWMKRASDTLLILLKYSKM